MKDRKLFYLLIGLGILNFIVILFIYPKLPEIIPIHWGIEGTIDGWGRKFILLLIALLPVILPSGMYLLPKIDPKEANYNKFSNIYGGFALALTLLLILMIWLEVATALNLFNFENSKAIPRIICFCLGIIFIVLGNYAPKVKQNWFFGFKTPWAIENKTNWEKTQRLSGFYYILAGIVLILNGFFLNLSMFIFLLIFLLVGLVYIYFYSYFLYKKEISNDN